MTPRAIDVGTEWIVDARGCAPERLRDFATLRSLFARVVRELALRPAAETVWKAFDGEGGVTGMALLSESHLTVHTFPEHGHAAFNLYCCVDRPRWDWDAALREALSAQSVAVREIARVGRGGSSQREGSE